MRMWILPALALVAAVLAVGVGANATRAQTLSSCTVWADPTAPDGSGDSLRRLIGDQAGPTAMGNAVICLPPGSYQLVALTEDVEVGTPDAQNSVGDLDVFQPLELRGVEADGSHNAVSDPTTVRVFRSGAEPFRLLDVHERPAGDVNTVIVRGLMLDGGLAGSEGDGNTGGALRIRHANVTLEHVVIRNSEAPSNGGGIDHADGLLELTGVELVNNTAGTDGGGLHNAGACGWDGATCTGDAAGEVVMTDSRVEGNAAGRHGGGVANDRGHLTITGSAFEGNEAGDGESHSIWNRGTVGSAADGILDFQLTTFLDGPGATFAVVGENVPADTGVPAPAETEELVDLPAGLSLLGWFGRATTSGEVLEQHPGIEAIWWLTRDGDWVVDSLVLPPALRVSITLERGTGVFVVASTATSLVMPL